MPIRKIRALIQRPSNAKENHQFHTGRNGRRPCFAGARVPVQTLMDYIKAGDSIDDFLEGFPTVKREQVIAFLEEAKNRMLTAAA
jgi:uncharacterized protein (DUF433 family)